MSSLQKISMYGTNLQLPLRLRLGVLRMNPAFSTRRLLNKGSPTDPKSSPTINPEYPKFSLQGLGISKNVRIVLYTIIGVWSTFETYFYYRAFMRWWDSRNKPGGDEAME
ncbi:hypothetical protein BJX99DRAFT_228671 [Aspergillus californicus]